MFRPGIGLLPALISQYRSLNTKYTKWHNSTFRITTEVVVSAAPLDMQLQDAKKELAEIEAKLVRIRDIPFILQPRGNVEAR